MPGAWRSKLAGQADEVVETAREWGAGTCRDQLTQGLVKAFVCSQGTVEFWRWEQLSDEHS